MRIALIYPPPWKIAGPGEDADRHGDGPPTGYREGDLDADFYQTPYGLFSLGAQAIRAGHQVKILKSGSPSILANIDKKITVDKIVEAALPAKKFGIQVRFFMMLGNRGETAKTFQETLDFLDRAKPHQYIFSCLSIYPGTRDFEDAEKAGWLDRKDYFTGDFQELKTPYDATEADTAIMNAWFAKNSGLREMYLEGVPECRAILKLLPDYHGAHMDLGGACFQAGLLDEAERHVRRALELGYPLPGLVYNYPS